MGGPAATYIYGGLVTGGTAAVDWSKGAANTVGNWTENAAKDAGNWAADNLNPFNW